jgi:hypothetical protein
MQASAEPDESPSFASLPPVLQHAILRRLPVDARARCACVCRGWRTPLTDVSLWTRLDLSPSSGVRVPLFAKVLRGASGLARGALTALDVSGCGDIPHSVLLDVVTANAGALTELRVCSGALRELPYNRAEALLRAVPRLRVLHADVQCDAGQEATRLLRNEPPFGPLRVRHLYALYAQLAPAEREAAMTELAAGIAVHDSLSSLWLQGAPLDALAGLDAVVDAVLLRRMHTLELIYCSLSPASAPALARLLGGSALAELRIKDGGRPLLDAPGAALLADALRANRTLTTLTLSNVGFWRDVAAATLLLGALTGHPSLRKLNVCFNGVDVDAAVAGAALSALVTANAPALRELDVADCQLGDVGLGPLVDALPVNTHLRTLKLSGNDKSEAFVRERLLPALRANSGLRKLSVGWSHDELEAHALVAARAADGADAAQQH